MAYSSFQSNAFQSNAFQATASLIIKLDGEAAALLGEKIGVLLLAEKIKVFWGERIGLIASSNPETPQ